MEKGQYFVRNHSSVCKLEDFVLTLSAKVEKKALKMQTPLTQMMLSVMGLELLPISNVLYMYIVRALWKLSKYHSDAQNKIHFTLSSI